LIKALTAALEQIAVPGVAVAVQTATAPSEPLWARERIAMMRAVPQRVAEFTAGRAAARMAMQALGLPKAAIPLGPDRAPIWPKGVVGSISHTDGTCVALVGRLGLVEAIGIDLELIDPLPSDLWSEVCTGAELAALDDQPAKAAGQMARLIFSAKECCYKCIYPQTRTFLGFGAMQILVHSDGDRFEATLLQPVGSFASGTILKGRVARVGGFLATVLILGQAKLPWTCQGSGGGTTFAAILTISCAGMH
jgi:4'-phosphopantetheinyl transferase EntD